jgi:CMP-N,N'-diacetyllegionaminic acid synthase
MKLNNEVWAFIPARSGSKSIKNKNIVFLKKKPLLVYSLLAANGAKKIDKIIFSSDSKKYFNIAKKYSNFFFHKRKKSISLDYSSDFEVFNDFVKNYKFTLPRFFVHLRPTTPFRDSKILDRVIKNFIKNEKKYSSLRSVSPISNSIYKSIIIKENNIIFSPIFRSSNLDQINYPRQKYKKTYIPNGYIDIIKTESILKGFLHGSRVMCYINKKFVSDIDNLNDLKIANYYGANKSIKKYDK